MGDGHHRPSRHQAGERDHPGSRRPYLRPGRGGEVHSPVSGRPGFRRRFEPPQHSTGPAHRPGPRRRTPFRPVSGRTGRGPRVTRQPQHRRHHQHHPGEDGGHPSNPTEPSHAPRLAVLPTSHHPLPDSCGQTAPAPDRCPSGGCTDAAIRCTSGMPAPDRGQVPGRRASGPHRPPAAADPPAATVSRTSPKALRRPSAAREVARPSALPVHFTRDPVHRVDFARPATGGRTRFIRSPARCECRSVRRARPVPGPSGWSGSARSGRQAWLSPGRHGQTETDPAVGGHPTGKPHGNAAAGP